MLGVLGNLSEDVAAQLGEVLGQLASLLLGEIVGKGEAALDRLLFIVPCVGEHQILGIGIERGVPIDVECRCLQRGFRLNLYGICTASAEFSKTSRPRS